MSSPFGVNFAVRVFPIRRYLDDAADGVVSVPAIGQRDVLEHQEEERDQQPDEEAQELGAAAAPKVDQDHDVCQEQLLDQLQQLEEEVAI